MLMERKKRSLELIAHVLIVARKDVLMMEMMAMIKEQQRKGKAKHWQGEMQSCYGKLLIPNTGKGKRVN
jgi:hypothetical protein